MNRKQRVAFWSGLAVVLGLALFPPHRVPVEAGAARADAAAPDETLRHAFVGARAGPVAWDRVRQRGLVVLLITYAALALLRTRPRGDAPPEDDADDADDDRDDLPPPPEPHPAPPRRARALAPA